MKQALLALYITIAIFMSICKYFFGEYSYRGYFYNLGRSVMWPIEIFRGAPEIDGDNEKAFAESLYRVTSSHPYDTKGEVLFSEAFNLCVLYIYAENNLSFTKADYEKILYGGKIPNDLFRKLITDSDLNEKIREELDGYSFKDLAGKRDKYYKKLFNLLDDRPYEITPTEKQDQPHREVAVTQEEPKVAQTETSVAQKSNQIAEHAAQDGHPLDKTQLCIKNKHAELAQLGVTITYEIADNIELGCGVSHD